MGASKLPLAGRPYSSAHSHHIFTKFSPLSVAIQIKDVTPTVRTKFDQEWPSAFLVRSLVPSSGCGGI